MNSENFNKNQIDRYSLNENVRAKAFEYRVNIKTYFILKRFLQTRWVFNRVLFNENNFQGCFLCNDNFQGAIASDHL